MEGLETVDGGGVIGERLRLVGLRHVQHDEALDVVVLAFAVALLGGIERIESEQRRGELFSVFHRGIAEHEDLREKRNGQEAKGRNVRPCEEQLVGRDGSLLAASLLSFCLLPQTTVIFNAMPCS